MGGGQSTRHTSQLRSQRAKRNAALHHYDLNDTRETARSPQARSGYAACDRIMDLGRDPCLCLGIESDLRRAVGAGEPGKRRITFRTRAAGGHNALDRGTRQADRNMPSHLPGKGRWSAPNLTQKSRNRLSWPPRSRGPRSPQACVIRERRQAPEHHRLDLRHPDARLASPARPARTSTIQS